MKNNITSAININIANNVNIDTENVRIVKIAIFENDYLRMVNNGKRHRGSLRLTADGFGDFLMHRIGSRPKLPTVSKTLHHGVVSVSKDKVHMHIDIDKRKERLDPEMTIVDESMDAALFVRKICTGTTGNTIVFNTVN
ncbi:MAG: hypothetical protein Q4D41_11950 [Prevotellaceae bacterium]|nr:hypothetical protein [Prevotellaceae bacterium]